MYSYHVMTPDVKTAEAGTPVRQIVRLMTEYRIGSVPVVDGRRDIIGIVRKRDLFFNKRIFPGAEAGARPPGEGRADSGRPLEEYRAVSHLSAADVMSREFVPVQLWDELGRVIHLMAGQGLGCVPVVGNDRLVGIITRGDLIRLLLGGKSG